jgi:hypothetical protein
LIFGSEEESSRPKLVFNYVLLLNALHIVVRHNPLLVPMIVRYRCKALLRKSVQESKSLGGEVEQIV